MRRKRKKVRRKRERERETRSESDGHKAVMTAIAVVTAGSGGLVQLLKAKW